MSQGIAGAGRQIHPEGEWAGRLQDKDMASSMPVAPVITVTGEYPGTAVMLNDLNRDVLCLRAIVQADLLEEPARNPHLPPKQSM